MPYARVSHAPHEQRQTFSNYRDWRAFLAAVQVPAAYASAATANMATALKAGHAWLTGLASRKTLGV
jgi:hypothetical protein